MRPDCFAPCGLMRFAVNMIGLGALEMCCSIAESSLVGLVRGLVVTLVLSSVVSLAGFSPHIFYIVRNPPP